MAIYDLVTGGGTRALPAPMQNGYSVEIWSRGTAHRMASGALVREVTSSGVWRRFTIEWLNLTETQRGYVDTAVNDMLDGSTATFTDPAGTSYTVTLGESGLPDWQVLKAKKNTELRYSGRLTLEQNA
jgi:hypothetical protein